MIGRATRIVPTLEISSEQASRFRYLRFKTEHVRLLRIS
jgi:hypothetical protein